MACDFICQRLLVLAYGKDYSFLNQLAFSKIIKKYDKITSRNASDAYLHMIEESYLSQSDEVTKLLARVEAAFVKHFCNGNRQQGMNTLRPKAKRERHRVTFFVGCFFGCSIALVVAIILTIHNRNLLKSPGRNQYMKTIFPLYTLFGYIVLHLLKYAANVYYWTRFRVNYSFIFGYKPGTELGFKEVLLVSSGLSVLTLAGILSNLEMDMDPNTQSFKALTELLPLALVIAKMVFMEDCETYLQVLRGFDTDISSELNEIKRSVGTSGKRATIRFSELKRRRYWYPLMVGIGLLLLQQLSGINGVLFYSSDIFKSAGISSSKPATFGLGAIQVAATAIRTSLVDKSGRRALLLLSSFLMVASNFLVSMSFFLKLFVSKDSALYDLLGVYKE